MGFDECITKNASSATLGGSSATLPKIMLRSTKNILRSTNNYFEVLVYQKCFWYTRHVLGLPMETLLKSMETLLKSQYAEPMETLLKSQYDRLSPEKMVHLRPQLQDFATAYDGRLSVGTACSAQTC